MTHRALCMTLASLIGCGGPARPATTTGAAAGVAPSQQVEPSVLSTWRGTSRCTVRPSPCNDEVVVYRFTAGPTPGDVVVQASKIVDDKEVDMGTLACRLDRAAHRVVCSFERGTFVYVIDGDRIHGTLDLTDGTRYRVIEVERVR